MIVSDAFSPAWASNCAKPCYQLSSINLGCLPVIRPKREIASLYLIRTAHRFYWQFGDR